MLYLDQVTGFGRICTQYDCTVKGSQNTFIGISGNIGSKMFLLSIKMIGYHTTGRTIEYQSVHIGLRSNRGQIIFFGLFILATESFFAFGTGYQRIFTHSGQ